MKENDTPELVKFQSFPQAHDLEERLQADYDILDFARTTALIRDSIVPAATADTITETNSSTTAGATPKTPENTYEETLNNQQDPAAHHHMGNLQEKLGQKIYELLHREGSVPTRQVSAILEQLEKQPVTTAPEFFNPGAGKERLIDTAAQLQFEKDCLEAGIDPREAELRNFGEITSPKASLIPFPKDEGLIAAISFIAIAALLLSTVILDYFF